MRRLESWYVGAALALLMGWGVARARSQVLVDAEAAGASSAYAECGEVLLHGYAPARSACPSLYMPLSSLTAARLFGHPGPRRWPWREAAILAGLLSIAALCVLAGAPRSAVAAVFLLLAWPELWPSHQSYVQFFYTLFVLTAA